MGIIGVYLGKYLVFEIDSTSQPRQHLWKPHRFPSNLMDSTSEVCCVPLRAIAMQLCSYLCICMHAHV